jgi:hypothetical protein
VPLFERSQQYLQKVSALMNDIRSRREQLLAELKVIDADWAATKASDSPARNAALARLEELYRLFGYYARWTAQLADRQLPLSGV